VDPWEEIHRSGEMVGELSLRHDVVVSRLFISSEKYHGAPSPLLLNIRREGVVV
jgi:hypothetical protein